MEKGSIHENCAPVEAVKVGSDRSFALVFAIVFALLAFWPLIGDKGIIRWWSLAVAAIFMVVGLVAPKILHPLNLLWFRLGLLMHHLVTPVVMGLIFFLTVTPIALIYRASGNDPLRLKRHPGKRSYWILRDPPGPSPESMKNQF